jgi:hypothetical protein
LLRSSINLPDGFINTSTPPGREGEAFGRFDFSRDYGSEQACKFVCLEETSLSSLEYRCRRPFAIGSTYEKVLACERGDGLRLNRETRITSKNTWKLQ